MLKKISYLFLLALGLFLVTPPYTVHYVAPEPSETPQIAPKTIKKVKMKVDTKPVLTPEVEAYINDIFGEDAKVATAVLMHESRLDLDAQNWNCIYDGKSTSCKVEDRHLAWSVDCGIGQTNIKGQTCPAELLTLEGNMKRIEEIYQTQGLNAWVSYKTGAYLKYL